MANQPHILIADDDPAIIVSLRLLLENAGYQITHASSPEEVRFISKEQNPELLLLDMNYTRDTTSGGEGLDLIGSLREADDTIPIVVMTGWATVDLAVAAMQQGASDFIQKPWDNKRLLSILDTQLALAQSKHKASKLSRENQILRDERESEQLPIVAESAAMTALLTQAKQAAASDVSILITGENGTGKSLLAEFIHRHSARASSPLINVNMGAIPESLFESELFGHAKGAFTDAKAARLGRVELAEGGTLFMDEIGNLPLAQQAKLLHLLENRQYESVGSSHSKTADIRVITATNADLSALVQQQQFRMDLLYRLNTVELRLPALKERTDDIIPLANAFCRQFGHKYQKPGVGLSPHAQQALLNYNWPGNIRELGHVMERAIIFSNGETLGAEQLMLQDVPTQTAPQTDDLPTLAHIEKQVILERLNQFDGNANSAADSLGLSRSAFYRRLDKYKL